MIKKTTSGLVVFALFFTLWSCGSAPRSSGSSHDEPKFLDRGIPSDIVIRPTALSHEMAWVRSHQIGKLNYILWFGLEDQSETYEGRVVVNFELKDLKKAIFGNSAKDSSKDLPKGVQALAEIIGLDFEGGDIHSISLNGAVLNPTESTPKIKSRYDGHRIYFHVSELLPSGANRIEIAFSQHFSTDGVGFIRYVDTEDKQTYLYTDSEPYGAHRIFPCFDQPDMKSSYELTVETPQNWAVIANTPERDVNTVDGRKSWAFPPSPVFSTYLFQLAAGPYASWKDNADGIPIRLFARQSQKSYIDADEWLETTKKGLDYYSGYFGYHFPYAKYDQIIVPDYHGAMENVAAVTFAENLAVRRSPPTAIEKRSSQSTLLHEMAHMWFGDLVTMKWWNGLWLNESFATYMSFKAQNELFYPHTSALENSISPAWEVFYDRIKYAAENTDQLTITHPVEPQIIDTDEAKTNFDDITYGKGASVLKQLNYYIGEENFQEGLQRYFQKYALRNTTTTDFIKMLAEASEKKDLMKWQKLWLQTAGINGLRADWTCDADKKINKFTLVQTPATEGDHDLRNHKTEVAFYKMNSRGKVEIRSKETIAVAYSAAETPVEYFIGRDCPEFVYPNHLDYDYTKVELDPVSLDFARKNLTHFESTFMRKVIWNELWSLVVDGKMSPVDLMTLFLNDGVNEKEPEILASVLTKVIGSPRGARNQPSLLKYLPESSRSDLLAQFDTAMLKMVRTSPPGSDLQRIWFDTWTKTAISQESLDYADKLFSGKSKLRGFQIGQPERWKLVQLFARNATTPEKQTEVTSLIQAESKIDTSDDGIHNAITAEVLNPDPASKKKWMGYLLAPLNGTAPVTSDGIALNTNRLQTASLSYISSYSPAQMLSLESDYFNSIPNLAKLSENRYAASFASNLFPSFCDQRIADETSKAIDAGKGLPPEVIKRLKMALQDEQRCERAQRKLSSTGQ